MLDNKRIKTALLLLWLTLLAIGLTITAIKGVSPRGVLTVFSRYLENMGIWGPLAYVAFYSVRSLFFFPASLLTITAGALFGPVNGLLLTMAGENISANLSFVVSRYFRSSISKYLSPSTRLAEKIACYTENNGFTMVLVARLVFLPFDLVGYTSGLSCIRQKDFALGTLLGTIPGLLTFTLLGSSLLEQRFLAMALVSLAVSLLIARHLKRKERALSTV